MHGEPYEEFWAKMDICYSYVLMTLPLIFHVLTNDWLYLYSLPKMKLKSGLNLVVIWPKCAVYCNHKGSPNPSVGVQK